MELDKSKLPTSRTLDPNPALIAQNDPAMRGGEPFRLTTGIAIQRLPSWKRPARPHRRDWKMIFDPEYITEDMTGCGDLHPRHAVGDPADFALLYPGAEEPNSLIRRWSSAADDGEDPSYIAQFRSSQVIPMP